MKNSPIQLLDLFHKSGLRRGSVFGSILLVALLAFEIFNYSTTDFALTDLLGTNLKFLGIRWATILSIAFCGIDFAGIARLFTPEKEAADEPVEVWYLFGAWVLAAAMNASLTWWGVAVAITNHTALGSTIVGRETISNFVPVFVAVMVWLIRILIIGTFAMAGDRVFSMADDRSSRASANRYSQPANRPTTQQLSRPASNSNNTPTRSIARPEPSYHPVNMAAKPREDAQTQKTTTWR